MKKVKHWHGEFKNLKQFEKTAIKKLCIIRKSTNNYRKMHSKPVRRRKYLYKYL